MNNFSNWLLEKLQERNWSQADLARASGLTRATISYYLGPKSKSPDETALGKIARAFKLPTETVFRAAGILPSKSPESELIEQITHIAEGLPQSVQEEILAYAQARQKLAEQRGEYATQKSKTTPLPAQQK